MRSTPASCSNQARFCISNIVGVLAAAHKERRKLRTLESPQRDRALPAELIGLPLMDKVLNVDAKRKTVTGAGRDPCRRGKEHGLTLQNLESIQEK